jgi:hypothetical protein
MSDTLRGMFDPDASTVPGGANGMKGPVRV